MLPKHGSVAQHHAGHIGEPRCEIGFELAVLLIDRSELAGVGQRLSGEAPEIQILADLGVVDVALAADPLQQDLRLCESGITPESVANLHVYLTFVIGYRLRSCKTKPPA